MLPQLLKTLFAPLIRLSKRGDVSLKDIKRAFSEEMEVIKLFYPYVAERQSAIFGMLWGSWLLAPWQHHSDLFSTTQSFSIIRKYITQSQMASVVFIIGIIHFLALYLNNHPIQGQLRFPRLIRRGCLFLETMIWSFLAGATVIGFPPSTGLVTFGFFGIGSWIAFRDTGNNRRLVHILNVPSVTFSTSTTQGAEGVSINEHSP